MPFAYSFVDFGLSMVLADGELSLFEGARDLKGCEGTNEYSVETNYRGRYVSRRAP